jgi:hypothetical protein
VRAHPHIYEINTWPWLERLTTASGHRVTLGTVPEREWDRLRASGFDAIYLMGVWQRSALSRQIARSEVALFERYDRALPGWIPDDIVGSPYSIAEYTPDPHLGTWQDLDNARQAVNRRGMRLILDFVANHTGFDHPWISSHPHRYVTASLEQFRAAPGDFRAVDGGLDDGALYIACGRDPYFPPWTDVAQLNYFEQNTREAMVAQLAAVAEHCDGVRCDMAMLVLDDVFARTWGLLVGRSAPPGEFWSEVRGELPDLLLIAEAYWDLEERLQRLGFSLTYDKRFYDALAAGDVSALRERLGARRGFQEACVRFLENHDERRSYDVFGPGRIEAAATLHATAPGARMFYDGQLEGRTRQSPVQLRVWAEESEQPELTALYKRLLDCVNHPVFHEGTWDVLDVLPTAASSPGRLVALWWHDGGEFRLVVANLGEEETRGLVRLPGRLPPGDASLLFDDHLRPQQYRFTRSDLALDGLPVQLAGGRACIFRVTEARH